MTKTISLACLLAACALSFSASAAGYKDGSYVGAAQGLGGKMKVQVTVQGGKISAVNVLRHGETEAIMAGAKVAIPAAIVKANSPEVDVIGGATYASNGIKNAVKDALKKAQ